jgi:DNA repair exonuclease SbcCD ATPase subunit
MPIGKQPITRGAMAPVAPRVLTEKEALMNYATVAHFYNDFIESKFPDWEERFDRHERAIEALADKQEEMNQKQEKLNLAIADLLAVRQAAKKEDKSPFTKFDPDLTPHGGIRLDQLQWEAVRVRFEQQEEEKRVTDRANAIIKAQSEETRRKLMTVIKVMGILFPILATGLSLLTHFLKVWG